MSMGTGEYQMTKDQASAAFTKALRYWWMGQSPDGKWYINYSAVDTEKVIEVLKGAEADTLGAAKDPKWEKFREVAGLDNVLKERLKVYKISRSNVEMFFLYQTFKAMVGDSSYTDLLSQGALKFNFRMILPSEKEKEGMLFSSTYIESAKASGKLRLIQTFVGTLDDKLSEKKPDPEDPAERNKFIWKTKKEGVEIRTYKVLNGESPKENAGDYIEVWRVTLEYASENALPTMKRESKPCIRAFASEQKGGVDVFVIDIDKENAEYGFGMPDVVEKFEKILSGKELFLKHQEILEKALNGQDPIEPKHKKKEMKIEIARSGEAPPVTWETAEDPGGFRVPFMYAGFGKQNYKVEIVYETPKMPNGHPAPQDGAAHHKNGVAKKIKHIIKRWYSPGNPSLPGQGEVVEYFKPKSPYDGKDILEATVSAEDGKKISITRKGQPTVIGLVVSEGNVFIEDIPYMIDFTDGDVRWQIADRENNDNVYESRRRISSANKKPAGDAPVPEKKDEFTM
jgi:hypothetical protein